MKLCKGFIFTVVKPKGPGTDKKDYRGFFCLFLFLIVFCLHLRYNNFKYCKMNLSSFSAATREHYRPKSSARTACNKKTSGINTNDYGEFAAMVHFSPALCCKTCLKKFELIKSQP